MNGRYVTLPLLQALFTVWGVITISFGLIHFLPGGGPEALYPTVEGEAGEELVLGDDPIMDPNAPLHERYIDYVTSILQGEFGQSHFFGVPVTEVLMDGLPWTIFLYSIGILLTFTIGIALGAILAYREGSLFDAATSSGSTFLASVPYYIAAVVMVWILGYQLELFPISGRVDQSLTPGLAPAYLLSVFHHAALPIISILITGFGFRALSMRGNAISVLGKSYVRVAKLRGLSDRRIAYQYVGRNAFLPMYTGLMIAIGFMIGGSVVLETIFQYQGLGYYMFVAIEAKDYPLMMASFIILTIAIVGGLLVADLTYGFIDPRAGADAAGSGSTGPLVSPRRVARYLAALRQRLVPRMLLADDAATARAGVGRRNHELFDVTAETTVSRWDRYRRMLDTMVLAPLRVMWRDGRTRLGAAILLVFVFVATVGVRFVADPDPNQGPRLVGAFQTWEHPLGTTVTGQDLLSLMVHSTTPMLKMLLAGAVLATVVATVVGVLAGYLSGWPDEFLTMLMDLVLAIPGLPLVMVLAVVFNPTDPYVIGALLVVNAWGGIARQIRSEAMKVAQETYVEASGVMGLSTLRILVLDLLPNIMPFILIRFVMVGRGVIVGSVALYFLGILPMTTQNWGVILNFAYENGALYTLDQAHWVLAPVIALVMLTYGLILFAQGMDQVFNPRVRARHAATVGTADVEDEPNEPSTLVTTDD